MKDYDRTYGHLEPDVLAEAKNSIRVNEFYDLTDEQLGIGEQP